MPVSTTVHISHCLDRILRLHPSSVLDVGCGFGLWGFLCREYLDVMQGQVQPAQWRIRIDGIELFEPYIQDHQRALYSSIQIGDIRELAAEAGHYDLIIAGDVIEHLEKDEGERVIAQLQAKARKALLINIPIGEGWEHPEQYGNPGELHRSTWYEYDFQEIRHDGQYFELGNGSYGVFYCPRDCTDEMYASSLMRAAERYVVRDDNVRGLEAAKRAHELYPAFHEAALLLADLAIRGGDTQAAIAALERNLEADPAYHEGRLMLAKLFAGLSARAQARPHLEQLLEGDGVHPECRAEAQALLQDL